MPFRVVSLAFGFAVTILVCLVTLAVFPSPWNYLAAAAAFLYVGALGINRITIGFVGVPTLLYGRLAAEEDEEFTLPDGTTSRITVRRALFAVPEGVSWLLPPPFMDVVGVDVREQATQISPFTVITGGTQPPTPPTGAPAGVSVRMRVGSTVIRWRVSNPAQSLQIGENVIRDSLVELVQQHLRIRIRGLPTDREAMDAQEQLRDEIQQAADVRAAAWGVDVIEVLLGEITPPDAVQEVYETRRQFQGVGDVLEDLRRLDATASAGQAIDFAQVQTNKAKRNIQTLEIGPQVRALLLELVNAFRRGGP